MEFSSWCTIMKPIVQANTGLVQTSAMHCMTTTILLLLSYLAFLMVKKATLDFTSST